MTIAFYIQSVPFTKAVIAGDASLGGSESACVGLARALAARGHRVHIFTPDIDDDALGRDHAGVRWQHANDLTAMNLFIEWDVFVALRMFTIFGRFPIKARLRLLWNQDMLVPGQMTNGAMASSWAIDKQVYVSEFHRWQWEGLVPELSGYGWVTKNGYDPALVPANVVKKPNQIIHISRPERGLEPLLKMWPVLRAQRPDAECVIARYSSMYDKEGWGKVCQQFDDAVAQVNAAVGGLTYLGELGKPELYRRLAESAVMWYPGVPSFGETSCIAAIESQACGTPFVGSWKGALPETAAPAADVGHLIRGDALTDPGYHAASVQAVVSLLDGCRTHSRSYREIQAAGLAHVSPSYTYQAIAAEWESQIHQWFEERYQGNRLGVFRQLMNEDDHVAAQVVGAEILSSEPDQAEVISGVAFCERVINGQDHSAEQYAEHALEDPIGEGRCQRFTITAARFTGCTRVLDVACGNGAHAIRLALEHPETRVVGVDFAEANIARARAAAETAGVADRVTFHVMSVYDYDRHDMTAEFREFALEHAGEFDGVFVGEFLEHVARYEALIDGVEVCAAPNAHIIFTCPHGPLSELLGRKQAVHKGHVHRFAADDLAAIFGQKTALDVAYQGWGVSQKGNPVGTWLIHYRHTHQPTGRRPLADRIMRTRPRQRLSVGIIAHNAENDLGRCLERVYPIADEIVIGDTGSTDTTRMIAESYHAKVVTLPVVSDHREGFAGARNAVLDACSGEWFLWIDADEVLLNATALRYYIEGGGPLRGFAIHQNHLYLDMAPTFDKPVRLFRRDPGIRFYGCVHEQPQDGGPNTDIHPALELMDAQIAHTGYLTEDVRRNKMLHRNLPLLKRDADVFPERRLGHLLRLRDYVNLAEYDREQHGGRITEYAQQCYESALGVWDAYFTDPADKHHTIGRPFYEKAVQAVGGWEMAIAIAGRFGGIQASQSVGVERVWVRTVEEYRTLVEARLSGVEAQMEPPALKVDPPSVRMGVAVPA